MGFREVIAGTFSFLRSGTQGEERVAQYVVREHKRGRPLHEILDDPYVTNRCTPDQIDRLLDRPELIHSIGNDMLGEVRGQRSASPLS
jgi:hypothetical protein